MADRCYLRDGVGQWPMERQEEQLRKGGHWIEGAIYRDVLKPAALKRKDPADLKERASMLRPTSRTGGETIAVASMQVLAGSDADLLDVMDKAARRNATIIAADTNSHFPPVHGADVIRKALEERKRSNVEPGARLKGVAQAAARKRANSARGIEAIKEEYRNPFSKKTDAELYDEAGLSRRTVEKALGTRRAAQAEAQRNITRRDKRHAAKARKVDQ